jgi:hypothetical protein
MNYIANFIVKKKILVGRISKLVQHSEEYWGIPIHVKANALWNLLVADMRDVTAFITFIQQKEGKENPIRYQAVWVNPNVDDDSFVNLHIGSKRYIGLASKSDFVPNTLLVYGQGSGLVSNDNIKLSGDYDVLLELRSDDRILGCWKFQKAIIGGLIQQVNPLK